MPKTEIYPWTREGVAEAVEDTMDCWPRLRGAFVVATSSGNDGATNDTWDVSLDPKGACRTVRLGADIIRTGALQQVAQALRSAVTKS